MGGNADSGTESFGALLRDYRGEKGLTQEQLAERAGLHVQTISQLELGIIRRPRSTTVQFLADALKLDAQQRATLIAAARTRLIPRQPVPGAAPSPRVFLSHTSDLGSPDQKGSFVAAAAAAVLRARHALTDMAYFGARETSPAATCVEMVAQSDIYVGIIGMRYGSPVRDRQDVSYTELEFEAAGEHDQPRLIFLIRQDARRLSRRRQSVAHRARQDTFRRRLLDSGLTVVRVGSPAELELAVFHALVELGPTPDAPARLAEAQALLASMPVDALPERGALPAGSRMPLAPNPLFVGRTDEILQVARALRGGETTVTLGQVVASTGLGGLGKTQLAVELVHRYGRFFAGGVYWLSFASADEVPLQLAACAGPAAMDLALGIEDLPVEERVQRVQRAWQSAVPRLLVFDNCEEETLLEAWRPTSGGCRVLVTSRRSVWSPTLGVAALALDLLPRGDSIELLRRYLPDVAADNPSIAAVAAEVGDLPLALHLAGSYLCAYRPVVSLDDYMDDLRRAEVVQHASLLGAGLDDSPSPTHHVQSVAQTFALCLNRLDREREVDQIAIALLARIACMAPGEPVPRDLLAKTLEEVDPRRRATAGGLRRLGAVGLVEEGDGWLRLHRLLVQFVRQEGLDPEAHSAVAQALIGCGEEAYLGHLTGSALAAVIPHAVDAAWAVSAALRSDRRPAELYTATGRLLQFAGDLRAARPWFERALATRERVPGPDHPDTAASLNSLAHLLWDQGELATARPLLERAQAIRERVLGLDHPDTALGFNDLGVLLRGQGELATARSHLERALATHERVLGPDHPRTALSLYTLGVLLRDQGELASSRTVFERALQIRQQMLGPDHPDTAFSLNGLARVLHDQGELDAARPLYERALNMRERLLGPDHPRTAHSINNLAALIRDEGNPAAARPLFERALAIREKVLGSDHPDTVATRRALAELAAEGDGPAAGG